MTSGARFNSRTTNIKNIIGKTVAAETFDRNKPDRAMQLSAIVPSETAMH